jgi:selenocysteine-specific translation elongation factor
MAEGLVVGVFGTDQKVKGELESSVAKKSEAEGIIVYNRKDGDARISLLDDAGFPDRIQGYSRVASISDYAIYLPPRSGVLTPPDGELAVLLDSFSLPGSVGLDGSDSEERFRATFRGTILESYRREKRAEGSPLIDLSQARPRGDLSIDRTIVYVDRAFNVNGLGTVVLGFVLAGSVAVHDELRPSPLPKDTLVEVKGIQINDVDYDRAERGARVGLALRGVDARSLQKTSWLDDGSFSLTDNLSLSFRASPFYRQKVYGRELHVQLPGELVPASIAEGSPDGTLSVMLPFQVPVWDGMRAALVDLNGKGLRVAGGARCKL